MKNRKEILREFPSNMVMVTYEFGTPIYIAPTKNGAVTITDKKGDAELWSELDLSKLKFIQTLSGYADLKFEKVN